MSSINVLDPYYNFFAFSITFSQPTYFNANAAIKASRASNILFLKNNCK